MCFWVVFVYEFFCWVVYLWGLNHFQLCTQMFSGRLKESETKVKVLLAQIVCFTVQPSNSSCRRRRTHIIIHLTWETSVKHNMNVFPGHTRQHSEAWEISHKWFHLTENISLSCYKRTRQTSDHQRFLHAHLQKVAFWRARLENVFYVLM